MSGPLGPIGDARVEVHVDFAAMQRDLDRAERMFRQSVDRMEAMQVQLRTTLAPAVAGGRGVAPAAVAAAAAPAEALEAASRRANAQLSVMRERAAAVGREVQTSLAPAAPVVQKVTESAAAATASLVATSSAATVVGTAVVAAAAPAAAGVARMKDEFAELRGRIDALAPAASRARTATGALRGGVRALGGLAGPVGALATVFAVDLVGGFLASAAGALKLRREVEEIDRKARIAAGSLEDLAGVLTPEELAALSLNVVRKKDLERRTKAGEFRDTSVIDVSGELGLPPLVRQPELQREAVRQLQGVKLPAKVEVDLGELGAEGDVAERIKNLLEKGTEKGAKDAERGIRETLGRMRELLRDIQFESASLGGSSEQRAALAPYLDAIRDFQDRNVQLADLVAERARDLHAGGMAIAAATQQASSEMAIGFQESNKILAAQIQQIGPERLQELRAARDQVVAHTLQTEAEITQDREAQTQARIQLIRLESEAQRQALSQLRAEIEASYLPADERATLLSDLDGLIARLETLREQQIQQVGREGTFLGQLQLELEQFPTTAELATSAIDRLGTEGFDALIGLASGSESAGAAFSEFAEQILREAGAMILKLLILKAIMAGLGALGGGDAGAGGVFGASNSAVNFPSGTTIPIAHRGGNILAGRMALVGGPGAEELFVPAAGGRIIPPDVLRALGQPRRDGGRVVVNNFSSEPVEVKQSRRETELVVGRAVASDVRRGGASARALEERGVRFTPRGR